MDEMARLLRVSRRTVLLWRQAGFLPFIKLPGCRRVLFDPEAVRQALQRAQRGGSL